VLIYIHGGGFVTGDANWIAPPNNYGFIDFYVSQHIVVVEIQYRLALLGFGSDGTSQIPGNLGLFDQRLALHWVGENIAAFNGDPSIVTLWGESAGSASVAYQTIDSVSSQYFHQAIQISGSFSAPWAEPMGANRSVDSTLQVAKFLGCNESAELKSCLKRATIADLLNAVKKISLMQTDFSLLCFGPTFDGDFVRQNITFAQAIEKVEPKSTLHGFMSDEVVGWSEYLCNKSNVRIKV